MSTAPIIPTITMQADSSTLMNMNTNTNTNMHSNTKLNDASVSTSPLVPSPTSLRELSHLFLDTCLSPLPEPEGDDLSDQDRNRLCDTLAQLRETSSQAQQAYLAVHASIQQYQQLVLSTHAQVAAAKQTLMQARGIVTSPSHAPSSSATSSTSASTSSTSLVSTVSSSNISSNASTPPLSPISPISPNDRHHSFNNHNNNTTTTTTKDVHDTTGNNNHHDLSPTSTHHPHHVQVDAPHHNNNCESLRMTMEAEPGQEQDQETKEMQLAKLKQQHAELGGRLSQLLRDKAAAEETKKRLNDGLLRTKARMKEIERRLGK